jgi:acyl-CoA synthetase (AMP-forming)/AMP-acid ligase II
LILRSNYGDVAVPDVGLADIVLANAHHHPEKLALVDLDTGRGYTYARLDELVDRIAGGLRERGVQPGDCIAVMLPNVPEFPAVFYGALRAGAAVTTLNPGYREREVTHQLRDSRARLIVTDGERGEVVRAAALEAGVDLALVGAPGADDALDSLLGSALPGRARPQIDPSRDLAAIPYSSGTTGLPKGVMLTHRNLVANMLQSAASQHVRAGDVLAGVLPFFHIYGMTVIMNLGLWRGATIVTMAQFRPDALRRCIEEHRVTRLYAAPPIILALVQHPAFATADLSSLQFVLSGAAPLGAASATQCEQRIGCRVVQGYGLTEASPCTHLTSDTDRTVPKASIGPLLPSTESCIVDPDNGRPVAAGEEGELWIRGPQVMAGYLHNPAATAAMIDDDGFLHTGDIARVDAAGYFYIVDRLKELIKTKGFQVAPAELEAELLRHDDVVDAAAIGIPDDRAGEAPKAFVVLRDGATVSAEDLKAFVAASVASYKQLAEVEFVDALPRSASGKLQRRLLRQRV